MKRLERIAIVLSGLLGASGVAAAAASSHAGAQLLGPYALIALTHAPVIFTLAVVRLPALFGFAQAGLATGAVLFCADLGARHFLGQGLFAMVAPLGGMLMIAGWLVLAAGAIVMGRNRL